MRRAIVLTPQIGGADGVSELGRQVVATLDAHAGRALERVDVWSLRDTEAPAGLPSGIRFRTARSSRMTFVSFGLREACVDENTLAIVLHAHLLPVALPLIRQGARVVPVLLGIEAWKRLRPLERAAFRRAWRPLAISGQTIRRFRQANESLADVPVRVCHPGLRAPGVQAGPRVPGRFALIVARMASNERYKGHDELLEVWTRVRLAVPDAQLIVAGGGDDEARLRAKAAALGLDGAVLFEGIVSDARLAALYRDAAFFVMPSRDEGFGLVYLEAMRVGTPCIASPGAPEEFIEHGVSGLIINPTDSASLGSAIVRLFIDDGTREAMGRVAARRVSEQFEEDSFAARLSEALDLPAVHTRGLPQLIEYGSQQASNGDSAGRDNGAARPVSRGTYH